MTSKWKIYVFMALFTIQLCHGFVIPQNNPDCFDIIDNDDLYAPTEKCSWLLKAKRDVAKYRNFFADLVQGENKDYALELQEIFNLLSQARDESDESRKEELLKYAKWLMKSTKNLNKFLMKKGLWKV
ncbi:uncharacterized protein LOC106080488 [Stomoxys calcitrans]|uniref:Uncharacterized protein n=1 Tax=Stomoxys calcitrans TaxID=35570 RepID=A0A1I8NPJ2_STOCA|nr:uncharacterized protein LOC106080488 [Stomoxys calcitrans]